jgi:hypothetical protein
MLKCIHVCDCNVREMAPHYECIYVLQFYRFQICPCAATVKQVGESFTEGRQSHVHPSEEGMETVARVVSDIKSAATVEMFTSSSALVNRALLEHVRDNPCAALPPPSYLARIANRQRQVCHRMCIYMLG